MKDLILLVDSQEAIKELSDCEAGALVKALISHIDGNEPESLPDKAAVVYPLIRGQVDRMIAFREKQARNGAKGGRPKKPNENPNETQINPNETQTKAPVPVPVPVPDPVPSKRFAPPTADDVREYATEKGLVIDADRFVDYYASTGWKVGGKAPMKDWRAAVRNWCARDKKDAPTDYKSRIMSVDYGDLLRRRG